LIKKYVATAEMVISCNQWGIFCRYC